MARTLFLLLVASALVFSAVGSRAGGEEGVRERQPYRDPELAALRSVVIPGWGQQSNGDVGKGLALTSLAVLGVLLGTEVISPGLLTTGSENRNLEKNLGWFLYGASVVWAVGDAYLRAESLNRENGYDLEEFSAGRGLLSAPSGPRLIFLRLRF